MEFDFTPQQLELKDGTIRFARKELNEDVISRDKAGVFSRDLWCKCADFGIQGLPFPGEFGGSSSDIMTTLLVMEGLGYGCRDSGLVFSLNGQMWTVQFPILRFGTPEQKSKYLPRLCCGELIGANGMTEPSSGSDSFALSTTARREGDQYVLNGTKTFISNAPVADMFLIYATVDKTKGFMGVTAFIVDKDTPGLKVSKAIDKMGLKTSPLAEIVLEDCRVPAGNLLGREGNGAAVFNDAVDWERSCMLACDIGLMERQLEECVKYARDRRQFKKPIGKFQAVSHKIAEMKVRLETARLILYKVAWSKKTRDKTGMEAAIAKLYVSESLVKSCLDAVQIHGASGYATEYELERDLRDSVASTIYSGTSEIQKNIIAHYLGL
ncbi:MAG: acyl-CoA dehydrogenase family protein [Deltaproteobacteria bacterium]